MTKRAFEQRIVTDLGNDNLSASPYKEQGAGNTMVSMTLYYKSGVHVGTWQGGKGWAFKSAYA